MRVLLGIDHRFCASAGKRRMIAHKSRYLLLVVTLGIATGCASVDIDKLKVASAGRTGCLPEENEISNVKMVGGDAIWNATCKGKVYLCSDVNYAFNKFESLACALVAQ